MGKVNAIAGSSQRKKQLLYWAVVSGCGNEATNTILQYGASSAIFTSSTSVFFLSSHSPVSLSLFSSFPFHFLNAFECRLGSNSFGYLTPLIAVNFFGFFPWDIFLFKLVLFFITYLNFFFYHVIFFITFITSFLIYSNSKKMMSFGHYFLHYIIDVTP